MSLLLLLGAGNVFIDPEYGLDLDGTGDYIREYQDIDLCTTDFTWECFFHTDWTPTADGQVRYIVTHGKGKVDLSYNQTAGIIRLFMGYRISNSWKEIAYAITLVEGQRYHLAIVYDNGGVGMGLYLGGVLVGSLANNGNLDDVTGDAEIVGARPMVCILGLVALMRFASPLFSATQQTSLHRLHPSPTIPIISIYGT